MIRKEPIDRLPERGKESILSDSEDKSGRICIGIVSDTHGMLREDLRLQLVGVSHILHAGDVGDEEVLKELAAIAPVTFVRGNMDYGAYAKDWPHFEVLEIGGVGIYILHDLYDLDLDPASARFQVVISGHTHHALVEQRDGILYINPGSAGPGGRGRSVSMARLWINGDEVDVEIVALD